MFSGRHIFSSVTTQNVCVECKTKQTSYKKKKKKLLLKSLVGRCKIRGGGSLLEFHSSVLTEDQMKKWCLSWRLKGNKRFNRKNDKISYTEVTLCWTTTTKTLMKFFKNGTLCYICLFKKIWESLHFLNTEYVGKISFHSLLTDRK